jgi:hypothetical protein
MLVQVRQREQKTQINKIMNHIKKLQTENKELKNTIDLAIDLIIDMQKYYSSDKFQGTENDYAHIKTDVYPKISFLKMFLQGSKNNVINI